MLRIHTGLLDDHRELEPPDPIPNSDVKRFFADGSVGFPHVRVGHRQAFKYEKRPSKGWSFFMSEIYEELVLTTTSQSCPMGKLRYRWTRCNYSEQGSF